MGCKLNKYTLKDREHALVELKAKTEDLDFLRKKLSNLKAKHVDTTRQIDIYFETPKGRLKLRETEGNIRAEIVYYERGNIAGPKRSSVFIIEVEEPSRFKNLLYKTLRTVAIVDKTREIYEYEGTKIHLDRVNRLGSFVEFERETPTDEETVMKNKEVLKELMEKLGISQESLVKFSYSDLIKNIIDKKG